MPFSFDVPMMDGSTYKVQRLLAQGKSNTKIGKSDKAGLGYATYSLSLAPAMASGFNLCPSASPGCRSGCLFTAGYARVHPRRIQPARIAKSRMLRLSPDAFRDRLMLELYYARKTVHRKGLKLAVRLNVLSDVQWEKEIPQIFTSFDDVVFYDYTKHANRMLRYLNGPFPANYHLTFSRSETNWQQCLTILTNGGNVAVPFHVKYRGDDRKPLPEQYLGYPITDGDITDLRFLDPQGGYIVGLRAKGEAKRDHTTGFVVEVAA